MSKHLPLPAPEVSPIVDSRHVTLTANSVATVTLGSAYDEIEVINRTGSAEVYFLVNPGAAVPTVKGDGTDVLPAAINYSSGRQFVGVGDTNSTVVKLISTGAPEVSVIGR